MKIIYKIVIVLIVLNCLNIDLKATTVIINVEDFEFSPSDVAVFAGDTIKWQWDNSAGIHTTTSTAIPAGALTWDQQISSVSQEYMYIPIVAGSYNYKCTPHFSIGMVGHFTVFNPNGIVENSSAASIYLNITYPGIQDIQLSYNLPETTSLDISMFNVEGALVYNFISAIQMAGNYSQIFSLANVSKGIYFIKLETKDGILSREILLHSN